MRAQAWSPSSVRSLQVSVYQSLTTSTRSSRTRRCKMLSMLVLGHVLMPCTTPTRRACSTDAASWTVSKKVRSARHHHHHHPLFFLSPSSFLRAHLAARQAKAKFARTLQQRAVAAAATSSHACSLASSPSSTLSAVIGKKKLESVLLELVIRQRRRSPLGRSCLSKPPSNATHPGVAALQRVCSGSSASSGTPGTPGGAEVNRILRAPVRPSRGRVQHASSGTATPPTPPEVALLVHAFHCEDAECEAASCQQLKVCIERVEAHVDRRRASSDAFACGGDEQCKTCKLWRMLLKTAPMPAPPSATPSAPESSSSMEEESDESDESA